MILVSQVGPRYESPFAPNLDFNSNTIHIEEHLRPGQPEGTKVVTYGEQWWAHY